MKLMETTVNKTADIAGTQKHVTSKTVSVQLAARRGTRQMYAKCTYVSNVNYRKYTIRQ